MKNIKELGLELIELEDQGLLVDKNSKIKSGKVFLTKENIIHNNFGWNYGDVVLIASTKPLEGLPLLVIEDKVEEIADEIADEVHENWHIGEERKCGFISAKKGYNKCKEKFKFTEEDLVEFAEWIEKEHWWKSTDTRFELTIGLWTKKINGDFSPNEGKLTKELLQIWKEQRAKKELWIEVEAHCFVCDKDYDKSNRCKQLKGEASICLLRLNSMPKIKDGEIKAMWK